MTRNYFLDYIDEFDGLKDLCREHDCDICDGIIDSRQFDEYVDDDISEALPYHNWQEIRDMLNGIPYGYDYYRVDGSFDYSGLDSYDFESYKQEVLEWMDENGLWDYEADEEEDENDSEEVEVLEPEEPEVEEEDFTVSDLMSMCGAELLSINRASEQRRREEENVDMSLLFTVAAAAC